MKSIAPIALDVSVSFGKRRIALQARHGLRPRGTWRGASPTPARFQPNFFPSRAKLYHPVFHLTMRETPCAIANGNPGRVPAASTAGRPCHSNRADVAHGVMQKRAARCAGGSDEGLSFARSGACGPPREPLDAACRRTHRPPIGASGEAAIAERLDHPLFRRTDLRFHQLRGKRWPPAAYGVNDGQVLGGRLFRVQPEIQA